VSCDEVTKSFPTQVLQWFSPGGNFAPLGHLIESPFVVTVEEGGECSSI
jgi:hypothetical protein